MNVFDEMGKYWAEIADKNQTINQIQFIKKTLPTKGLILDLACGTGRHTVGLSNEGYDVVGIDISSSLLKIAKNRWNSVQLVKADMQFLPFKLEAFSAAISMDTSIGYLPSPNDDLQSLSELHWALCKNGVLIIDIFNSENLVKRYKFSKQPKCREYPSFFLMQNRFVEANGDKLHDIWTVRDKANGQIKVFEHTVRLIGFEELKKLLELAGFGINQVYGDYEGQSFSPNSNRLIFIAYSF